MDARTAPHPGAHHPTLDRKSVGAVVLGNALEFYDFTVYAFFAKPMRSQSRFSAADLISAQAVATHMARLSADMGSMKLEPPIAEERVPDIS